MKFMSKTLSSHPLAWSSTSGFHTFQNATYCCSKMLTFTCVVFAEKVLRSKTGFQKSETFSHERHCSSLNLCRKSKLVCSPVPGACCHLLCSTQGVNLLHFCFIGNGRIWRGEGRRWCWGIWIPSWCGMDVIWRRRVINLGLSLTTREHPV